MPARRPAIIAHHLIWTLYGHWLSNDLRGSGSEAIRDPKFEVLGEIYHGRKPKHEQPTREELREFHKQAGPLLQFRPFWIDEAKRQAMTVAVRRVVAERDYTVWACAILSNHMHMVIRRHRDDALTMWKAVAEGVQSALSAFTDVGAEHPVLAARPYKVFLRTPDDVRGRIRYVNGNPEKEGLPEQQFDFVELYDNWPFHKTCTTAG
jgi:REP element-mobilizing transposase RayT